MLCLIGLTSDNVKETFSNLFNTIDNQKYIGELAGIENYGTDFLKIKDRESFLK